MGSAAVVPPSTGRLSPPYHLAPAEYAISNIVFGRLKVARFASLNTGSFRGPLTIDVSVTQSVPEPSTGAMMILGFLGAGYMAYRWAIRTRLALQFMEQRRVGATWTPA